jgi:hypothetical protein
MRRKLLWALVLTLVALGMIDLYFYQRLENARRTAEEASRSLQSCNRIAERIEELRSKKSADAVGEETADIASYVERTAKNAGLAADAIVYIEPGIPKPVEDTALTEQSIHLAVERSPLEKLGRFLRILETGSDSLRITGIRIVEPRDQDSPELWNCEVNLTQTRLSSIPSTTLKP